MKHGAEHTNYRPADVDAVRRVLARHDTPRLAATWTDLARECGLSERRLRAIATDYDGGEWLLAKIDREDDAAHHGLYLARSPEDAASLTAELRSKADTLGSRIGRREYRAASMTKPTQLGLFGRTNDAA